MRRFLNEELAQPSVLRDARGIWIERDRWVATCGAGVEEDDAVDFSDGELVELLQGLEGIAGRLVQRSGGL